jgi:hypothetical protein
MRMSFDCCLLSGLAARNAATLAGLVDVWPHRNSGHLTAGLEEKRRTLRWRHFDWRSLLPSIKKKPTVIRNS